MIIHILLKNNEETIQKCIESIRPLSSHIFGCDVGSTDSTIRLCKQMGVKVKQKRLSKGLDEIRNEMIADVNDWILYIEPWEVLQNGHQEILRAIKEGPRAFDFLVVRGTTITKETRLWHSKQGIKFHNPVYETITCDKSELTDCVLISETVDDSYNKLAMVNAWKQKSPTSNEPYYYQALTLLANQQYDQFLLSSENYLFREYNEIQTITMLRYYRALVYCYIKNDPHNSLSLSISCLGANSLMAEFWCCLGDIQYKLLNDFKKATKFYQNVIELGSQRLRDDDWPMDVSKYNDYPKKMISSCDEILSAKTYTVSPK